MKKLFLLIPAVLFYSCKEKCADCRKHTAYYTPSGYEELISEPFEVCGSTQIKNAEQHIVYKDTISSGTYTTTEFCICVNN